jgi:hypothetical protein
VVFAKFVKPLTLKDFKLEAARVFRE